MTSLPTSSKPRRRRQPVSTRERLVKAALEVISELGFETASTDEIVRRAGLTNGALYTHFGSKNELLAAALQDELSPLETMISVLDVQDGNTIDKLVQIVRAWDRLSPKDGNVTVETLAKARRDPTIGALFQKKAASVEAAYARWLRRGQINGEVRSDVRPEAVARLLSSIAAGYVSQAAAGVPSIDSAAWISLLVHVVESLRPVIGHRA